MTDKKITQLTALTGANAVAGDQLAIVDVSDTTMSASGTTKKIALSELQAAPLSGGTANGVAYLNGSKVLTTGSALTFDGTNLGLAGTGNRGLSITTNTSGNPSISLIAGGVNSGFIQYSRANQSIELSSDGSTAFYSVDYTGIHKWFGPSNSEQMRLTSTGLGIGTSSPAYKLDVSSGSTTVIRSYAGAGNQAYVSVAGNAGVPGTSSFDLIQDSSSNAFLYNRANTYMAFGTNNTERMRLDASGNLGIGTSSPNASAILDAQSTTKGVRMPNMTTTQKNAIASPAAGLMVFDTTLAKLCVYSGAAWETITSL